MLFFSELAARKYDITMINTHIDMIQNSKSSYADGQIEVEISRFSPSCGTEEMHACLRVLPGLQFTTAWSLLQETVRKLTEESPEGNYDIIWQRFFLSDVPNQLPCLSGETENKGARSFIGQYPLNGSKIVSWLYAIRTDHTTKDLTREHNTTIWRHNGRTHVWSANYEHEEGTSEQQTYVLMKQYMDDLHRHQATLADNCIRTWFYIRDIDLYYTGLVKARKDLFEISGLTPQTHYIASTGIEGKGTDKHVLVHMDAYAVKGLQSGQISYLHAPTHLNPTHEYGVTFERGTAVTYGDRTHLFISGTASINNRGEIVHPYHVEEQTLRMWENVETLLAEKGADGRHIMQAIVYLRDASDYPAARDIIRKKLPDTPVLFVLAPVCRPGWLIEMECIAVLPKGDNSLPPY